MTPILASYMQNVSISLLSGDVLLRCSNSSDNIQADFTYVNSTCSSTWDAYAYSPNRLLSTYGLAILLSFIVMLPSCLWILRDGAEEMIMTSHIIQSALNPVLFHVSKGINFETQVRLEGNRLGLAVALPLQTEILLQDNTRCGIEGPCKTSSSRCKSISRLSS